MVHCASRYACVRFDMTAWDWAALSAIARDDICQGILDAGLGEQQIKHYCSEAGQMELTRTHGRREVAFLNRAWEAVLQADLLVDQSHHRQPGLNYAINSQRCRCAGFEGTDTPLDFLRRCLEERTE